WPSPARLRSAAHRPRHERSQVDRQGGVTWLDPHGERGYRSVGAACDGDGRRAEGRIVLSARTGQPYAKGRGRSAAARSDPGVLTRIANESTRPCVRQRKRDSPDASEISHDIAHVDPAARYT